MQRRLHIYLSMVIKKNMCLVMDFRFCDRLVKATAFSYLMFVCAHYSGRHLSKMHLHVPKGNMQGQSPFGNVAGNILIPAKQYKSRTQGRLREYHKKPHF